MKSILPVFSRISHNARWVHAAGFWALGCLLQAGPVRFESVTLDTPGLPVATLHLMSCPDAPVPVRRPVILMLGALDSNVPPAWSTNLLREGWTLCAFSVAHPPDPDPARRPQWLVFDERFAHGNPLAAQRAVQDSHRVVGHLGSRPDVDPEKLGWFGSSSTGIPGLAVATQGPRLAAVVVLASTGAYRVWLDTWKPNGLWSGGPEGLWPETGPLLDTVDPLLHAARLWPTATLLINGGEDKVVDIRSARAFADAARPAFTRDPARLRLITYEGFSHNLPEDVIQHHAEHWFRLYLHPVVPPPPAPAPAGNLAEAAQRTEINAAPHARVVGAGQEAEDAVPVDLGSRLELFADDFLISRLSGCALRLHEPVPANVALRFDAPWEGPFSGYVTVLQADGRTCCYYRGLPVAGRDGSQDEVTCYAESTDGIRFTKPMLGLFEVRGSRSNNVVLAGAAPYSHNFSPFLDASPGAPAAERFKALAGTAASGLHGFVSPDGIHWRPVQKDPVITRGAFDSQNVAFWSESERCYVLYLRTWSGGDFQGYRTISRATSTNFVDWSAPVQMTFGDAPPEPLYTSQTHPYFRAPHLYVATPMRFVPGRQVLTPEQARILGVDPGYVSDAAEAVFMTSRGGTRYSRRFLEGFIRPGPDPGNWASRAGLTALGIVPTGPAEMSLYKQAHYAQPSSHLMRYTLRTDGFVSVNAPFQGGEFVTRPLVITGSRLILNFSTGAAGSLRVEVQEADGTSIPGFSLAESPEWIGDDIERTAHWKSGRSLESLRGRPLRLRVAMRDADLYSLQFR
ncbi:MAG: prolyl oligopeptidase family serine peptidase [Verrucomicrobia bacterium]|nr:prolyl oligopeptidase family serine peptidase [Verrucomicrobiota bacterium]